MDILNYLVSLELVELGITAAQFNAMDDKKKMCVFNEIRFQVKSKLRRHVDLLRVLDREIAKRLFDGCDNQEH